MLVTVALVSCHAWCGSGTCHVMHSVVVVHGTVYQVMHGMVVVRGVMSCMVW